MKCYIAGPMKGRPGFNFPAFDEAEERFRALGWEVVNPARLDREQGFDPFKDEAESAEFYMRRDLPHVCGCDAIALLPGWQDSGGANDELTVAKMCGLLILDAETMTGLSESILDEAKRLVHGGRGYDHPARDFGRTGRKWGATLDEWRWSGIRDVPARLVALCMVDLKTVREAHSPKRDNRVDGCGYLEAEDMVIERNGDG